MHSYSVETIAILSWSSISSLQTKGQSYIIQRGFLSPLMKFQLYLQLIWMLFFRRTNLSKVCRCTLRRALSIFKVFNLLSLSVFCFAFLVLTFLLLLNHWVYIFSTVSVSLFFVFWITLFYFLNSCRQSQNFNPRLCIWGVIGLIQFRLFPYLSHLFQPNDRNFNAMFLHILKFIQYSRQS